MCFWWSCHVTMCCGIFIWQTHKLSRGSHTNHFPLNTPFMCLPSVCFVEPGLNLVILGQIKTKPGCVVCVCSVSAHLWTLALQDTKGTHMLRFPTKWWKLRKACMRYKEYEVKVNVVDSRGKCCPSCLHTAQVFLLLSSARLITPLITAKQLSAFPGQIIKRNKRNPHALSL